MAKNCEGCPAEQGLSASGWIEVCGTPTPQCGEWLDDTREQLSDIARLRQIALIGSGRVLDLTLLVPDDNVQLYSAREVGMAFFANPEDTPLYLELQVESVSPEGYLTAQVVHDAYFAPSEGEEGAKLLLPIPEGEHLTIYGSCARTQPEDLTGSYDEADNSHTAGMLHVGRHVTLGREIEHNEPPLLECNMLLQEVKVSTDNGASVTIFDTSPTAYRYATYE
jgi:hypothetical protein